MDSPEEVLSQDLPDGPLSRHASFVRSFLREELQRSHPFSEASAYPADSADATSPPDGPHKATVEDDEEELVGPKTAETVVRPPTSIYLPYSSTCLQVPVV